jgi:hypothetical protein
VREGCGLQRSDAPGAGLAAVIRATVWQPGVGGRAGLGRDHRRGLGFGGAVIGAWPVVT